MKRLAIYLEDGDPRNESSDSGSFLEKDGCDDDLSLGVRRICQLPGLRKLALSTLWILSPSAFGPHPLLQDIHCPALREMHIDCATITPDGKYLYTRNPEDKIVDADDEGREELYGHDDPAAGAPFDSDDSDTSEYQPDIEWARQAGDFPGTWYRCTPDSASFDPLAKSFVMAATFSTSMPALRWMKIVFGGQSVTTRAPLEMAYFRCREKNLEAEGDLNGIKPFEAENAGCPRWYLYGGRDFDPSWTIPEDLMQAIKGPETTGKTHLVVHDERGHI
ncbi:hypothetical protein F5883DRAFT_412757 [Diaporthe sp. PMI_573]|nr:hypothetical protein F5883DRAFT_412757 [Diaporthaceae sp. PMI_573]